MDLLYSECYTTRREAMSCEWYIKRDKKFRATLRECITVGIISAFGKEQTSQIGAATSACNP